MFSPWQPQAGLGGTDCLHVAIFAGNYFAMAELLNRLTGSGALGEGIRRVVRIAQFEGGAADGPGRLAVLGGNARRQGLTGFDRLRRAAIGHRLFDGAEQLLLNGAIRPTASTRSCSGSAAGAAWVLRENKPRASRDRVFMGPTPVALYSGEYLRRSMQAVTGRVTACAVCSFRCRESACVAGSGWDGRLLPLPVAMVAARHPARLQAARRTAAR